MLGLERQMGQQPAGLRTHMLVGVGAALIGAPIFIYLIRSRRMIAS